MNTSNLSWDVLHYDYNSKEIKSYNVFSCNGFYEDCKKCIKNLLHNDKNMDINANVLSDEIDKIVSYYFRYKCEFECMITGNPPEVLHLRKVDIYDQLKLNWDIFINNILNNITYFLNE